MTTAQRTRFYGPAWRKAKAACWQTLAGTVLPRPGRPSALPESGLPTPDRVDEIACGFARAECRAMTEADLRRAIRTLAVGRDVRSADRLTHPQLQRVVAAMRLLADPEDLGAVLAWDHSSLDDHGSMVRWLQASRIGEPMVEAMSRSIYGTGAWRTLPHDQLRSLCRLVWKRSWDRSH